MTAPLVVVTRPEHPAIPQADAPLSDALREVGLEPIVAPGFRYDVSDDVPDPGELDQYLWVAWTSAAAVAAVQPVPGSATRHAAVGGATAEALSARGITPALVGKSGSADLAELLVAEVEPGSTVLYPRSDRADSSFAERLRSFDIEVVDRTAYRIGPADPDVIAAALARNPAAVTFASPSAVQGFTAAAGVAALDQLVLASIGSTTTGAMRTYLRAPDAVAADPSFPALARATAGALASRQAT
jgi:uroporphyrinogen-III synthase